MRAHLNQEPCRHALEQLSSIPALSQGREWCGATNLVPSSSIPSRPLHPTSNWTFLFITLIPKTGSTALMSATSTLAPERPASRRVIRSGMLDRSTMVPCHTVANDSITEANSVGAISARQPFLRTLAGAAEVLHNHCGTRFLLNGSRAGCFLVPFADPLRGHPIRFDANKDVMRALVALLLADVEAGFQDPHVFPQALQARTPFNANPYILHTEALETDLNQFYQEAGLDMTHVSIPWIRDGPLHM
ncbi:hypothetical protein AB1Y20_001117 [Prymnesium parvum]|uniref:Uncharacterized protein n=1 Tax=Prymnesium parvum TaxID=97485 RepID=A0AB34KB17_PRYPA